MKSKMFEIGGKPFHALIAGDPNKPLLLFLHGFPEYSGAWTDIMHSLEKDWYCVAPDQRGFGKSWKPDGVANYEVRHLSADVVAMIEYFSKRNGQNGRAAALIGHDWGASVAYAAAMRAPELIDRLVIINGVHPVPFQTALAKGGAQSVASKYIDWLRADKSEDYLVKDDFSGMFSLFNAKMNMDWLTPALAQEYRAAWGDLAGVRAMVNWYRASTLSVAKEGQPIPVGDLPNWRAEDLRIKMPHLLIWGMKDTALLPECHAGLEAYCEDLTRIEIADGDHWVIHQYPKRICDEIKSFIER